MRREFPPRRGLYAEAGTQFAARFNREWPAHSIRTAIAAIGSLYIARLVGLPEAYWATITTVVVMQSTLGVALTPSRTVFVGTALGAAAATYFGASTVVFTLGIFVLGLVCALLRLDRNDYRFAGSTLAIVVLVSHEKAGWVAALQRFVEVSIGIGVGLLVIAAWPERDTTATKSCFGRRSPGCWNHAWTYPRNHSRSAGRPCQR